MPLNHSQGMVVGAPLEGEGILQQLKTVYRQKFY